MSQSSSAGQRRALRRFVIVAFARVARRDRVGRDPVDGLEAGHAGLNSDGPVALLEVPAHRVEQLRQVLAAGVPVGEAAGAARSAQQLVERHVRRLGLDVP